MSPTSKSTHIQNPNGLKDIQEYLLFYLKDYTNELHFTTFEGPRYNEYVSLSTTTNGSLIQSSLLCIFKINQVLQITFATTLQSSMPYRDINWFY